MLQKVGLSFCVADAVSDIQELCDVVCTKKGGEGAVREMIEYILHNDKQKELRELWV